MNSRDESYLSIILPIDSVGQGFLAEISVRRCAGLKHYDDHSEIVIAQEDWGAMMIDFFRFAGWDNHLTTAKGFSRQESTM